MKRRKYLQRSPNRKTEILEKALKLSERITYVLVTYSSLSEYSKLSTQLIGYYFKSNLELQKELIAYAIEKEYLPLIAQGIAAKDSLVLKKTPMVLKIKAVRLMENSI